MTLYVPPTTTSLGLGSGDSPTFTGLTLSGNLTWTSGTSPAISGVLVHENTSSTKTYTFPNATGTVALTSQIPASFGFTIGDASSATVITTGTKAYIAYFPYAMTITGWYIFGSPSGSIVIDVWKRALGAGVPTVAHTITGTEKPTLSGVQQNSDTSLSSWTGTAVSIGDCFGFNVDSCTSTTFCQVVFVGMRSV